MEPTIKPLPREITTYDLLKLLAVVTMVVDHLGSYLFPEQMELRAIGRMSMPIWLFLVGYANTRDIPPILWGGALILLASSLIFGDALLNLNILFTIIITRFVLDALTRFSLKDYEYLIFTVIGLVFLVIPASALFDYGTLAFLWAMVGFVVRHKKEIGWSDQKVFVFTALVSVIYIGYQSLFFGFEGNQNTIMAFCVGLSAVTLYNFKAMTLPELSAKMPAALRHIVKFCGRRTLYIYVVHIILFMAIAFFLFPEEYGFLHLRLY